MKKAMLSTAGILRQLTLLGLVGIVGATLLMMGRTAAAQQLVITEVYVDVPDVGQMTIDGADLDNGPDLTVTLGEFADPLGIDAASTDRIIVQLPVDVDVGDYLLTVRTGNGPNRQDVYNITIGAPAPVIPPPLPMGAIILWDQGGACPAGFVQVAGIDGRFLRVGASPGTVGGANSHSHAAGTFTAPAHRHNIERPWNPSVAQPIDDNSGGTDFNARTDMAGGGTVTGTSSVEDNVPEYVTMLLCRKN